MSNYREIREKYQKNQIYKKSFLLAGFFTFILLSYKFIIINNTLLYQSIYKKFIDDNFFSKENLKCDNLDPIYIMAQRLKKPSINICKTKESEYVCFQDSKYDYYNKLYRFQNGVICLMKNFTLDPHKSYQTNLLYKGPVDKINRGSAIVSKGFLNMKCNSKYNYKKFSKLYRDFFRSWDFDKMETREKLEELAPGKTVFFINRNQDSPNLFHGLSEIMNTLSIMYLFDLKPENIQIIFLESMKFETEPVFDIYLNIIMNGTKPLYLRDLTKKYRISSAVNIPVGGDSPLFLLIDSPDCKYSTKTYKIFNYLINKYMNIPKFKDSFKSDKETFYYPNLTIKNHKLHKNFSKIITVQWRKVWPKGRIEQKRILGNGPELADKLEQIIPRNFLIRLVDTASLSITQQISLMKNTDYFIGIHGAGLALSIFMPNSSILHEILPYKKNKLLSLMSKLSGHKTYSDIINNRIKIIDKNEYIFFNENDFANCVLKRLKENYNLNIN